jgi:hypothetical protein
MDGCVVVDPGTVVPGAEVVGAIGVVVVADGGCVVVAGSEASSAHAAARSSRDTTR